MGDALFGHDKACSHLNSCGTDIAIESADIIILGNRLQSTMTAREISRRSYRKMLQNIVLAFMSNGIGIPVAATGLIYPVWAMVAMAVSVTAIFFNSFLKAKHVTMER